jgi:uncharacterized membrane protein (UPF0127 family)
MIPYLIKQLYCHPERSRGIPFNKILITLTFLISYWLTIPIQTFAIYNPLSVPNNRLGVHILHPDEIELAAKLVNNDQKGAWGYVTIPIQATDRNRLKWLAFMERAKNLKIIPIIRIATFAEGPNWAEPDNFDLTDFANFLNDLPWPTQNCYIVVFNEVNRSDEYGGYLSPEHYTDILGNAIKIFKSRSDKFFILPAGLDNAAANNQTAIKWSDYLRRMYRHNPDIFNQIDGWTSHAYPNPEFTSSPLASGQNKIDSFKYDLRFIRSFTQKNLPVFITETGWSNERLVEDRLADYFKDAFTRVWQHPQIVAITPFLLQATGAPFQKFSLMLNHQPTAAYTTLQNLSTTGEPLLDEVKITKTEQIVSAPTTPTPTIKKDFYPSSVKRIFDFIVNFFGKSNFTQKISVGDRQFQVEIVTNDADQQIGLSKYTSLNNNQGMLFQFENENVRNFWMKDMKLDIDIIWLNHQEVVGVSFGDHQNPNTLITSPQPVDQVLEVNHNSGIKIGDKMTMND